LKSKKRAEQFELVLPTAMQGIYDQRCVMTGVPVITKPTSRNDEDFLMLLADLMEQDV